MNGITWHCNLTTLFLDFCLWETSIFGAWQMHGGCLMWVTQLDRPLVSKWCCKYSFDMCVTGGYNCSSAWTRLVDHQEYFENASIQVSLNIIVITYMEVSTPLESFSTKNIKHRAISSQWWIITLSHNSMTILMAFNTSLVIHLLNVTLLDPWRFMLCTTCITSLIGI